jgi:hypothetical protein
VLLELRFQAGCIHVAAVEDLLLVIQLGVKVRVLFLAIDQDFLLIVDFLAKRGDHADVGLNAGLHFVLKSPFIVSGAIKVLFERHELVLESLVSPLPFSKLESLLPELGNDAVLAVDGNFVEVSFWTTRHSL